jgi:hypothetical protein
VLLVQLVQLVQPVRPVLPVRLVRLVRLVPLFHRQPEPCSAPEPRLRLYLTILLFSFSTSLVYFRAYSFFLAHLITLISFPPFFC